MNANAEKWVEALESGDYKQGMGYLRHDDSFCCLGVACDLYVQEHPGELEVSVYDGYVSYYSYGAEVAILPTQVQDWIGLRNRRGAYGGKQLTADNDRRVAFADIAAAIRSEPEGLFAEKSKT